MRLFSLAILLLAWTLPVHADDDGRISDRGRRMLSGSIGGTWHHDDSYARPGGSSPRWSIWAEPSFLYFVRNRVGLGGYLGYDSDHGDFIEQQIRYGQNTYSAGLSTSLETVASENWGLFLNVNLGYAWTRRSSRSGEGAATYDYVDRLVQHDKRVRLGFRLPLTYHVSSSLGLGLGPDLLFEWVHYDNPGYSNSALHMRLGISSWIAFSF